VNEWQSWDDWARYRDDAGPQTDDGDYFELVADGVLVRPRSEATWEPVIER
jgi:hypothetical protein